MNAQLRPQFPGRRLLCNALRFLAIDAVERAGNGHPGMPMGMAEIAEALWRGYLKHDPADPHWVDRDRFVLSNGHWFTDDTPARFEAYGWRVIRDVPGHDSAAIEAALGQACQEGDRPTLVCCKTVIGHGSPHKADTHEVHGAALGAAEVAATRAHLGWTAVPFEIPPEIRAAWDATTQGAARHTDWRRRFAAYAAAHPELGAEFERRVCRRELPAHWQDSVGRMLAAAVSQAAAIASRKASQNVIEALQPVLPELLGRSADLTGSNLTAARGSVAVRRGRRGNHINYGVREFGMSALMNGIALHGGYLPYGGTFLTFSDYSRNAVRMSALMRQRVIYVFTHDSIGLG